MLQSGGVLRKSPDRVLWSGTLKDDWGRDLPFWWASYGAIYRSQLWVAVLVNKLGNATARLPLKVYERGTAGRPEAPAHPYSQLLRQPSKTIDPFSFWLWVSNTKDIYGEAFLGKIRDRGGRPVDLLPMHPTCMHDDGSNGQTWRFDNGSRRVEGIPRRDIIHFKEFAPDGNVRGMSRLEPLRCTLENEDGARRANSALWRNGGRPSMVLSHQKTLSQGAADRLSLQWSAAHGGVDSWAKTVVLEEGTTATVLPLNVEELQYVEARKLNREEACAAYDVPPPVVHILDRATFSNITEQMRSMYRDTMEPKLQLIESTLEFELRDGRLGEDREPDFGEGVYAEFLRAAVLQGSPEQEAETIQKEIHSGVLTPAEARAKKNLPFIEGSDRLLINSTLVPLDSVQATDPAAATDAEHSSEQVRSVLGRLSRQKHLDEVDPTALVAGLNGLTPLVLHELDAAKAAGESVPDLRRRIGALAGRNPHG